MVITWQSIITLGAVLGALGIVLRSYNKGYNFVKRQEKQDEELKALKEDFKVVREEQKLITYGVLCCLKGLAEQGANGPVHEAINKIEKYLNEAAHS